VQAAVIIVAIVVTVVLGQLGWAALYRPRKGRFRIRDQAPGWFSFRTDFGEFTIDGRRGLLLVVTRKDKKAVSLADIRRLQYRFRETEAVLEELLGGMDIWDFTKKYRDVIGWYEISAVLSDGKRIPIYVIGQYEPREPLSGWWFEIQKALLAKVGLVKDVEEESRAVLQQLQAAFSAAGRPLGLV